MKNEKLHPRRFTIGEEIVDLCGADTPAHERIECTTTSAIIRMMLVTNKYDAAVAHLVKCISRTVRYSSVKDRVILDGVRTIVNDVIYHVPAHHFDWYVSGYRPSREDLLVVMPLRNSDILALLDAEEHCSENNSEMRR